MAMAHAVAALALLFLLATPAAAARTVADTMQELCSKTQFPKVCSGRLAALPESQKATPRRLAEMFVTIAAQGGSGMAAFVHGKYNGVAKDDAAAVKCYDGCSEDVEEAVGHLNGLVREPTDGKFLELKSWLASTLGATSACEDACRDAPKTTDVNDVVKYSVDFEKLLRITLDLITEASGSMSSADIALPPADAPFAGYGSSSSSSSAEGPVAGPVAQPFYPSSPAYGAASADASAPSSDASSADAPGPAVEEPGASAPGPSVASAPATDASAPSEEAADAPESDAGAPA